MKCKHEILAKLIEIPGKKDKEWGTTEYEMSYAELEKIAHKLATGEGEDYCYLEFLCCCKCSKIIEINEVFTG